MNISCGSLNHCLYLYNTDEILLNPYTLDSGPAVAPTCHDEPVVIDEYNNSKVSTLNEDNNKSM